jgi:hypothetical protein
MRALYLAAAMMLVAAIALPHSLFVAMASSDPVKPVRDLPKAIFLALPHPGSSPPRLAAAGVQLTQWNGNFTDLTGKQVTYTMVGPNPATTNTTSVVSVVIIPIKMVYGVANGNRTFDPLLATLPGGQSLMTNILSSPLFQSNVTFVQGGTNVGTTQYIDAFQRANFWSQVGTNNQYHVLLGTPTVLPEQTIVVPIQDGMVEANPFGSGNVGTMYVTDFDTDVQGFIAKLAQINPSVLPIFVTYDTYLTQLPLGQQCCIGGYHSSLGAQPAGQTYSYATYVDTPGAFAENVDALSHELGEWMDDPFVDNNVNCTDNSLMENGDPLENNANYGTFPYTANGFTYNLQSLVFVGYFGAPKATSLNSWLSFQNDEKSVCPGQ